MLFRLSSGCRWAHDVHYPTPWLTHWTDRHWTALGTFSSNTSLSIHIRSSELHRPLTTLSKFNGDIECFPCYTNATVELSIVLGLYVWVVDSYGVPCEIVNWLPRWCPSPCFYGAQECLLITHIFMYSDLLFSFKTSCQSSKSHSD